MNFIASHVIFNVVAKNVVKAGFAAAETAMAKYKPELHANYVQHITEIRDAATEAFIVRNVKLSQKYAPDYVDENLAADETTLKYQADFDGIIAGVKSIFNPDGTKGKDA